MSSKDNYPRELVQSKDKLTWRRVVGGLVRKGFNPLIDVEVDNFMFKNITKRHKFASFSKSVG